MTKEEFSPFDLEDKSFQITTFALKYGFFAGLGMIIVFMLLVIADLQYNQWASWLSVLTGCIVSLVGAYQFKTTINPCNYLTFGQSFKTAFYIYFIGGLILFLYSLFYIHILDPEYIANLLKINEQKLQEKELSTAQIEQALEFTKKFMTPLFMALIQFIFTLVISTIIGLIAGIFFKKND